MHRLASFQRNLHTKKTSLFFIQQQLSQKVTHVALYVTSILALAAPFTATAAKEPTTIMCLPGERIFSETFDPDTVSHRRAFKGDFSTILDIVELQRSLTDATRNTLVSSCDVNAI